VLPESLSQASTQRPEAMTAALEPAVTNTIRGFARRESELLGEILSPTIGAAVRVAVKDAMAALLQRFNEALERSLSLRSINWRIEARRTGRPFAEVVLLHTLLYRVEQAFLIHAGSGLILSHVVAADVPSVDPDQVAAMIDAIDSFVREGFRPQPATAHVREFAFGDLSVWIEWGPPVAVAAVVRGNAPRELKESLREVRERIALQQHDALASFVSDVAPFERARPLLESCLLEQRQRPPQLAQWILPALIVLAAVLSMLWFVSVRHANAKEAREAEALRATLAAEPGIVVTGVKRVHGRYHVTGFRDPLAAQPERLTARHGLPPPVLQLAPFESLDPPLVAERARRALDPPVGVKLRLHGSTLSLAGEAPQAWIDHAHSLDGLLAGVSHVDTSELRSRESLAQLETTADALRAIELQFALGSSELDHGASLRKAGVLSRRLLDQARAARVGACVTVVGDADPRGSAARNSVLAYDRARVVGDALTKGGVDPERLRVRGASDEGPRHQRRVRFLVDAGVGAHCAGAP
jgi:OOP family OmpA-OmpF porin